MNRVGLALLAVLLGCALPAPARAQSAHYWTNQFGNRARLLGGAVVGSVNDLSAVYYNPGALALLDEPQLLLAGNVYQLTRLRIADGLGEGRDLGSSRLVGVAPLFAGPIRLRFLGKHRLAYALLTRQSVDLRVEERSPLAGDVFGIPHLRTSQAEVRLEQTLGEFWAGLAWSYPLGEHLAIGVSPFLAVRSQKGRQQLVVQALGEGGQAGLAFQSREYFYRHARLLAKVGVAADYGLWRFGASLTTPGLGLMGRGHSGLDSTLVSQGTTPAQVTTDFQRRLSASYRSPLSVGAGGSRRFGDLRLHVAAEWFAPMDEYLILDARPFRAQTSGRELSTDVMQRLHGVLNGAVGLEYRYTKTTDLYLSFRTDYSAQRPGTDVSSALTTWDLYHFTTGASFNVARYDFTLGASFAFGDFITPTTLDFGAGDDISARLEPPGRARVDYSRLTLVLGVTLLREPGKRPPSNLVPTLPPISSR